MQYGCLPFPNLWDSASRFQRGTHKQSITPLPYHKAWSLSTKNNCIFCLFLSNVLLCLHYTACISGKIYNHITVEKGEYHVFCAWYSPFSFISGHLLQKQTENRQQFLRVLLVAWGSGYSTFLVRPWSQELEILLEEDNR